MGGGGKAPSASPSESAMAGIASQVFTETTPLREQFLGQFSDLMSGSYDPMKSPQFAPIYDTARTGLEAQYKNAASDILANTPRGGGQVGALSDLQAERAQTVGSLPGQISQSLISDIYNKAYGTATLAPQTSIAGLSGATQAYGQRQAIGSQNQANLFSTLGRFGQGAGLLLGGK